MKACSKLIVKCAWGGKKEGRISEERASVEGKNYQENGQRKNTFYLWLI